jgi:hypothetical protein
VHGPLGGGQQGEGCESCFGGELLGAGDFALEAIDAVAVLIAVLVGEAGGEVAGLRDLVAVEGRCSVDD